MRRVLTALLLVPLVVFLIFRGPELLFLAALAAVGLLCFREYCGLVEAHGLAVWAMPGYAAGLLVLFFPQTDETGLVALLTLFSLTLALSIEDLSKSAPSAAAWLLGVLYTFLPWRFAFSLRGRSPHWLLFALAVNWAGDSAALYAGRAFGRHKFAPHVSPGKSWEGSAAGLLASVVCGGSYLVWALSLPIAKALLIAAVANIAGQTGDLAESALKRGAGKKDSGSMLPGHGGWLDRLDSSLFSVPVTYLLAQF